ncbi:hypothetical protein Nepgr_015149 [Nepenthes gracilis]|uniref:Uncharacterized protein n=1 Tax=Nepenthes gracilis TaxID=150966 RepID=A0AAD3SKQ7_NEPGR|nr:hypothetical protein Nepgr_015149 [Nepenthes gracilis]
MTFSFNCYFDLGQRYYKFELTNCWKSAQVLMGGIVLRFACGREIWSTKHLLYTTELLQSMYFPTNEKVGELKSNCPRLKPCILNILDDFLKPCSSHLLAGIRDTQVKLGHYEVFLFL